MANNEHTVSPKDAFLHLLAIITLYISAGSFIALLFQYINYWVEDQFSPFSAGSMRWAVAILIIVFPTYVFTMRFLQADYAKHPSKRDLRIRKWLIYLTLFLAALIMIGDLITLIYNFLEGDYTTGFLLKVLTVLLTVGAVFWYYYIDIRKHPVE